MTSHSNKYLIFGVLLVVLAILLVAIPTRPGDAGVGDKWLTATMKSIDGTVQLSFSYPDKSYDNGPNLWQDRVEFNTRINDPNYTDTEEFHLTLLNIDATSSGSWMSKQIEDALREDAPPQHTSSTMIGRVAEVFEWNYSDGHSARIIDIILSEHTVLEIYEKLPEIGKDPMTDEQKRLAAEYDAHFARYHATVRKIIDSIRIEKIN
ncbi:MAG TPA: hypothetical protein VI953_01680 [Candidatus Paceibacterota bacterium]